MPPRSQRQPRTRCRWSWRVARRPGIPGRGRGLLARRATDALADDLVPATRWHGVPVPEADAPIPPESGCQPQSGRPTVHLLRPERADDDRDQAADDQDQERQQDERKVSHDGPCHAAVRSPPSSCRRRVNPWPVLIPSRTLRGGPGVARESPPGLDLFWDCATDLEFSEEERYGDAEGRRMESRPCGVASWGSGRTVTEPRCNTDAT